MLKLSCVLGAIAAVIALSFVIDAESRPTHRAGATTIAATAEQIHAPGRIEGASEEIDLRARLFGRVEEVLVSEGQTVAPGDVLVELDAVQQECDRVAAEAELAAAEAELDRLVNGARAEERREADADVDALTAQLESIRQRRVRISNLRDKGAATAQELDDLTGEVKTLEAQIESARARRDLLNAPARDEDLRLAQARLKTARARLDSVADECGRALLRAPCAAQVLRVNIQAGELTGPDSTDPPLILADTSHLFVRAYVDEFDAPRVECGMPARVAADGLRGFEARGRVVRLAPRMTQKPLRTDDPQERFDTKVREVWIELDDSGAEKLVVGLPVDVVLVSGKTENSESESPNASQPDGVARAGSLAPSEAGPSTRLPEITPVKNEGR